MICFATFDSAGNITGLFPSQIFPTPPEGSVVLNEEEYVKAKAGGLVRSIVNDVWVDRPLPVRLPAQARAEKLAALAAHRYAVETGGLVVGETRIETDRESQAMLTGAWVRVQQAPELQIDWKGSSGWVALGKSMIEQMAAIVGSHVQLSFSTERLHAAAIDGLPDDVSVIDAYDISTGWPG